MKNIILSIFLIVQSLNASLNINVENNTHLKGSLISSDEDNLNFTTNTLTFANSSNSSYSSSKTIGGSISSNVKGDVSNLGYNSSNSLEADASKTLATLGTGNITIKDKDNSDELDRLNRDKDNVNKDLYSSSTGTKVDATLDTRLLTEDGRKEIAEDVERSKRLGQAITDVATSDSVKIKDTFNHIGDVQKDLDVQKALALNDNGQTINILENQQNYSQEQIDRAINDYAQIYASIYGINIEEAKMAVIYDKYGSTYTNEDNTNSNIYLDKTKNQNALNTANTLGHEVAHVRQNQGQTYLRETTQLQEEYSDLFGKYSSSGLDFSSNTYNYVKLDSNKKNSLNSTNDYYTLLKNSVAYKKDVSKANGGDGKIDDRVTVYSRPVIDTLGITANHLFIVVDEREDGKPDIITSLGANGNMLKGGTPIVEVKEIKNITANIDSDNTLEKDSGYYMNNTYNDKEIIKVPKDMTQSEFDELVIKNANLYDINKNLYPSIGQTINATIDTIFNGSLNNPESNYKNSNTFVDNVIEQSDGNIKNFPNASLQNSGELSEYIYKKHIKENNRELFHKKMIEDKLIDERGFKND